MVLIWHLRIPPTGETGNLPFGGLRFTLFSYFFHGIFTIDTLRKTSSFTLFSSFIFTLLHPPWGVCRGVEGAGEGPLAFLYGGSGACMPPI